MTRRFLPALSVRPPLWLVPSPGSGSLHTWGPATEDTPCSQHPLLSWMFICSNVWAALCYNSPSVFPSCWQLVEKAGILFTSESLMIRKGIINKQKTVANSNSSVTRKAVLCLLPTVCFLRFLVDCHQQLEMWYFPFIPCLVTSYFYFIGPCRTLNL